eukprot:CAMPEP_0116861138 /NCGR_PEP_ID=MMETSP0418-20121206/22856_1 /TAXON_ID=1158023 /ORGANISM="Astrosyne radiata, Strain 13vi08-1A" /LENGTH=499 /DNA_ID=CAMNT_0004495727 /DNA_START=146 /DNA_END=1642 /DNA_ORIENTATION=+
MDKLWENWTRQDASPIGFPPPDWVDFGVFQETGDVYMFLTNRATSSGMVEVHVLSAATAYQSFFLNTVTPIPLPPPSVTVYCCLGPNRVMVCFFSGDTASGFVEIKVLNPPQYTSVKLTAVTTLTSDIEYGKNFVVDQTTGDATYIRKTGTRTVLDIFLASNDYLGEPTTVTTSFEPFAASDQFAVYQHGTTSNPESEYFVIRFASPDNNNNNRVIVSKMYTYPQPFSGCIVENPNNSLEVSDDIQVMHDCFWLSVNLQIHRDLCGYASVAELCPYTCKLCRPMSTEAVIASEVYDAFFSMDQNRQIFVILHANTDSGKVEISATNEAWNGWTLDVASVCHAFSHPYISFDIEHETGDCFFFITGQTNNGHVEVHAMSESSVYQKFILHAATPIPLPDANQDTECRLGQNRDVVCSLSGNTASGFVEVQVLSPPVYRSTRFKAITKVSNSLTFGKNVFVNQVTGDITFIHRTAAATVLEILEASRGYNGVPISITTDYW